MADLTPRALPGMEGARFPFFSPDGQCVGFFADGKLKKTPLAGGTPVTLAEAPEGSGASWSTEGEIVFLDKDITRLKPYQISIMGMARTFQNICLFPQMTVCQNVMVGRHAYNETNLIKVFLRPPSQNHRGNQNPGTG